MPLDQAEAIVLRSFPVGEQDKLVVLFCRDKGILRGVAKGARKFGNRFGSSLEPLTHVRAFFYEKERRELVTVSQCDILQSFFDAQRDYGTACTLAYFAELVEEFIPSRAQEEHRLPASPVNAQGGPGRGRHRPAQPLLRSLVPAGERPASRPQEVPALPEKARGRRLAVAEDGGGLLFGLRAAQEGPRAGGHRPVPRMGAEKPAAGERRAALPGRRNRGHRQDVPGAHRFPPREGTQEPAVPQNARARCRTGMRPYPPGPREPVPSVPPSQSRPGLPPLRGSSGRHPRPPQLFRGDLGIGITP